MKKSKIAVWDGLPVRKYTYKIKFITGDRAGQIQDFEFHGHVGCAFEKLSWLVSNYDMSIPKYEILEKTESDPLTVEEWNGGIC